MWFGVLGPLLVIENSESLKLGGPKQRTVLAVLLAAESERVSAQLLIEAVYGEEAGDRARRTIQTYVSNLRRALGDVIAAETGGWRLDLNAHQLDAREFEERYRSATQSDLDPRERVELLDSALEIWRGEPYEQVEAHGMLESEVTRLREVKLGAEAARIDAALAMGLHVEVVANTESLMAQFPYDERLRAQHMLGLYRSGRQQDALASYGQMRERLAQELGIDPSPWLQELEQKILEQHPSLDLPTLTRSEAGAAKSADVEPNHNLPTELTEFIGREDELEQARGMIVERRLVTLTGPGGSGKTRLAIRTAEQVLDRFPDGIWYVDLASLDDPNLIPDQAAGSMGLQPSDENVTDFLCRSISADTTLLVLDNCEHLLEGVAPFISSILHAAPSLKVVTTSREPLKVAGEAVYQIPPMSVPPEDVDTETAREFDSVKLFQQRAALAAASLDTSSSLAAAAEICRRLDGMPLAINLAAARTASLTPEAILERLDHWFRFLAGGPTNVPPRQRSLEATIEWSYDLLSEREKTLFRRLSVFRGGFNLEGAEFVCGMDPLDQFDVFDLLGHLVDKSLIQATEDGDGIRYSMLETVSQYGARQLTKTDEAEVIRRRHAEYFLRLAKQADAQSRGAESRLWFSRLDVELDNLRKAMGWALEAQVPQLVQELVGSLRRYFMFRYRHVEGREWALRAVDASAEPTSARATALLAAGTLILVTAENLVSATEHLDGAIELSRSLGLHDVLQTALHNRQNISKESGEWEEAEQMTQEVMELARNNDPLSMAYPLMSLSSIALDYEQDHPLAIERAREALRMAEAAASERETYTARMALAVAYRAAGELDRAGEMVEEVEKSLDRTESEFVPGHVKFMQAMLAVDRGEFEKAAILHREHMVQSRAVPEPEYNAKDLDWAQWNSARLLHHLGASEVSAEILGATDALLQARGSIRPPRLAEDFERVASNVRKVVGEQTFEDLYQRGRHLSPKEVYEKILDVLNEIIDRKRPQERSEAGSD